MDSNRQIKQYAKCSLEKNESYGCSKFKNNNNFDDDFSNNKFYSHKAILMLMISKMDAVKDVSPYLFPN